MHGFCCMLSAPALQTHYQDSEHLCLLHVPGAKHLYCWVFYYALCREFLSKWVLWMLTSHHSGTAVQPSQFLLVLLWMIDCDVYGGRILSKVGFANTFQHSIQAVASTKNLGQPIMYSVIIEESKTNINEPLLACDVKSHLLRVLLSSRSLRQRQRRLPENWLKWQSSNLMSNASNELTDWCTKKRPRYKIPSSAWFKTMTRSILSTAVQNHDKPVRMETLSLLDCTRQGVVVLSLLSIFVCFNWNLSHFGLMFAKMLVTFCTNKTGRLRPYHCSLHMRTQPFGGMIQLQKMGSDSVRQMRSRPQHVECEDLQSALSWQLSKIAGKNCGTWLMRNDVSWCFILDRKESRSHIIHVTKAIL